MPGNRARRAVATGAIEVDDPRASMCSRRTERLFLDVMKEIFEYGMARTPAACVTNPFAVLSVRGHELAIPDPTLEVTFTLEEVRAVCDAMPHPILAAATLLRAVTAERTGEMTGMFACDVDTEMRTITVYETEGAAPKRLTPDGRSRARSHLKRRNPDDSRTFSYAEHPLLDAAVALLVDTASDRHALRTEYLKREIARLRGQGRDGTANEREAELRVHLAEPPRLVTMPNGAPFHVSNFSKRYWKPALVKVFPDDTRAHDAKRLMRFYSLRSTAVQFMVEDCGVGESDAAALAGHSVETQRRHYRRVRGDAVRPDVQARLAAGAVSALG